MSSPRRRLSVSMAKNPAASGSMDENPLKQLEQAKAKEAAKATRRRASISYQASVGGGLVNDGVKEQIRRQSGIESNTAPKDKMNIVLKLAKEKGKTADQIFKYFDKDGDQQITPEEFKSGLAALDPVRFSMTDEEIAVVVKDFDKDGDGMVDMNEFRTYCLNLPGHAWKAERLRAKAAADKAKADAEAAAAAAPAPAPAEEPAPSKKAKAKPPAATPAATPGASPAVPARKPRQSATQIERKQSLKERKKSGAAMDPLDATEPKKIVVKPKSNPPTNGAKALNGKKSPPAADTTKRKLSATEVASATAAVVASLDVGVAPADEIRMPEVVAG